MLTLRCLQLFLAIANHRGPFGDGIRSLRELFGERDGPADRGRRWGESGNLEMGALATTEPACLPASLKLWPLDNSEPR